MNALARGAWLPTSLIGKHVWLRLCGDILDLMLQAATLGFNS